MQRWFTRMFFTVCFVIAPLAAQAGMEELLALLNYQAQQDRQGYEDRLSAQFGLPPSQVQRYMGQVASPADAFLLMQLAELSNRPYNQVLPVYKTYRNNGWADMARHLGIAPGSSQYQRFSHGDFHFMDMPYGPNDYKSWQQYKQDRRDWYQWYKRDPQDWKQYNKDRNAWYKQNKKEWKKYNKAMKRQKKEYNKAKKEWYKQQNKHYKGH